MTTLGLDVYSGNSFTAFAKARAEDNIQFVIRKATQGVDYRDPGFAADFQAISDAGLLPGAYHFAHNAVNGPIVEAESFLAVLGARRRCLLALDLEDQHDGQTMGQRAQWALAWLSYVTAQTGIKPLIYTYHAWTYSPQFASIRGTYPLWIPLDAPGTAPVTQWTHVIGTLGNLDVDTFAGTLDELKTLAGIATPVVDTQPLPIPVQPPAPIPDPKENAVLLFQDASGGIYFLTGAGTVHVPTVPDVQVLQAAGVPFANPLSDTFSASLRGA